MRKNTLAGAVAFGIAGLFVVGGVANADQGPGTDIVGKVTVDKKAYKAGDSVDVSGECHKVGDRNYTVTSPAFASPVRVVNPETDFFGGKTKIGKDVKPGTYAVSFTCAKQVVSTKLTVVATEKKQATKPAETTTKGNGQVAVKPKGAANTGGGDVAAAPAQESGSNTGLYVLGGAGLIAAGGAGAFMLRRRSRTQN